LGFFFVAAVVPNLPINMIVEGRGFWATVGARHYRGTVRCVYIALIALQ